MGAPGRVGAFEETAFEAFVKNARVLMDGELELTFVVPLAHKYLALPVTDVPGMALEVYVRRRRRR